MNNRITTAIFTAIATITCTISLATTVIDDIVEPLTTVHPNNRPAHFHWTFESESGKDVRIGQFACGSYWVAPAEGDSGVRLLSLTGNPDPTVEDLLSLDDDPIPHAHGLLHRGTRTYGSNDPSQDDIERLPIVYTPKPESCISLVSAMQRNEVQTPGAGTPGIKGGVVDAYCIVTVMSTPPPNNGVNSIRPNIVGDTKELLTWDDIDLNRLPSHAFIGGISSPEIQRIRWTHSTEIFSMLTWDGDSYEYYSEGGRGFRPHILHHDYGAGWMYTNTGTIYQLMGNDPIEVKRPVLAALIASGLDIWHFRYDRAGFPGAWNSGAGQWGGQFTPAAFAAALLKDPAKANRMKKTVVENFSPDKYQRGPQELRQIQRGNTGVLLWGDGHEPYLPESKGIPWNDVRYWTELYGGHCYDGAEGTCKPSIGQKTMADPFGYIDGPPAVAGSSYCAVTAGGFRAFAGLMLLMPKFREVVNTDAPIEYADRIGRHGIWTAPDPVAVPPDIDEIGPCSPWEGGAGCNEYRITWGPTLEDGRFAIEDGSGRFTSRNGKKVTFGYTVDDIERNWSTIIARYDGRTFEDRFTPLGQCVEPDIYIYPENGKTYAFLWSGTKGSTIHYTIDGSEPNSQSPIFTNAFAIEDPSTIRAISTKEGIIQSRISSILKSSQSSKTPSDPSDLTSEQLIAK